MTAYAEELVKKKIARASWARIMRENASVAYVSLSREHELAAAPKYDADYVDRRVWEDES